MKLFKMKNLNIDVVYIAYVPFPEMKPALVAEIYEVLFSDEAKPILFNPYHSNYDLQVSALFKTDKFESLSKVDSICKKYKSPIKKHIIAFGETTTKSTSGSCGISMYYGSHVKSVIDCLSSKWKSKNSLIFETPHTEINTIIYEVLDTLRDERSDFVNTDFLLNFEFVMRELWGYLNKSTNEQRKHKSVKILYASLYEFLGNISQNVKNDKVNRKIHQIRKKVKHSGKI